jgi:hypothetical protein
VLLSAREVPRVPLPAQTILGARTGAGR